MKNQKCQKMTQAKANQNLVEKFLESDEQLTLEMVHDITALRSTSPVMSHPNLAKTCDMCAGSQKKVRKLTPHTCKDMSSSKKPAELRRQNAGSAFRPVSPSTKGTVPVMKQGTTRKRPIPKPDLGSSSGLGLHYTYCKSKNEEIKFLQNYIEHLEYQLLKNETY